MRSNAPIGPMFDAELGLVFLKMRTLVGATLWDMARAVHSEPTVIADLEAGAIAALPAWPELTRLVHAYAAISGVDPHPILARLARSLVRTHPASEQHGYGLSADDDPQARQVAADWEAFDRQQAQFDNQPTLRSISGQPVPNYAMHHATAASRDQPLMLQQVRHPQAPASEVRARLEDRPRQAVAIARRGAATEPAAKQGSAARGLRRAVQSVGRGVVRGLRQRGVALVLIVAPFAIIAVSARFFPGVLYAAATPLPTAVRQTVRHGIDYLVSGLAPSKEGLTWIDVGDPRLRKTDKLRLPAP